jgi:hypothetical protein
MKIVDDTKPGKTIPGFILSYYFLLTSFLN